MQYFLAALSFDFLTAFLFYLVSDVTEQHNRK
jgi:hypothetical protein